MKIPAPVFAKLFPGDRNQSTSASPKLEVYSAKGPVFSTAIVSGVLAAKKTPSLIPFCHPVMIERCDVSIELSTVRENCIHVQCCVSTSHKTGVEMEALVGVSAATLCIYDMLKALTHEMEIVDIRLQSKTGGKQDYTRGRGPSGGQSESITNSPPLPN